MWVNVVFFCNVSDKSGNRAHFFQVKDRSPARDSMTDDAPVALVAGPESFHRCQQALGETLSDSASGLASRYLSIIKTWQPNTLTTYLWVAAGKDVICCVWPPSLEAISRAFALGSALASLAGQLLGAVAKRRGSPDRTEGGGQARHVA